MWLVQSLLKIGKGLCRSISASRLLRTPSTLVKLFFLAFVRHCFQGLKEIDEWDTPYVFLFAAVVLVVNKGEGWELLTYCW